MDNNIINTSKYFEYRLLQKEAAKARGKIYKEPKIRQAQKKAKEEHQKTRSELNELLSQKAQLDSKVDGAQAKYDAARDKLVQLNDVNQCMDLSGASAAVFYDNDDCVDVSYIIDGEEMYKAEDGKYISLKERRKQHRAAAKNKDNASADMNEESCPEEADESGEDGDNISYDEPDEADDMAGNFRLVD